MQRSGAEIPNELLAEALARFGVVRVGARGHSMRPLIPDGSLVELRQMMGPPRVGEVVAAAVGTALVIHRVTELRGERVVLRGDGALKADAPLHQSALIGRAVRATLPNGFQVRLDNHLSRLLGRLIARHRFL